LTDIIDEKKLTVTDPPHVLVLRRTGIRTFPSGEKVALYYSPKLKKTFSVPYNSDNSSVISVTEEYQGELNESVIHQLHGIVRSNTDREVKFVDKSKSNIDVKSAEKMLGLYYQLNSSNKKHMSDFVNSSSDSFKKAVHFAKKHIK
jgi:hypothetical protein